MFTPSCYMRAELTRNLALLRWSLDGLVDQRATVPQVRHPGLRDTEKYSPSRLVTYWCNKPNWYIAAGGWWERIWNRR